MNNITFTNVVCATGRLTKDPSKGETAKGTPYVKFTLASDKRFVRKHEEAPTPNFLPVIYYGDKVGEYESFLEKGAAVAIRGEIRTDSYTNKEGTTVYTWEIKADEIAQLPNGPMTGTCSVFLVGVLNSDCKTSYTKAAQPVCVTDLFVKCGRQRNSGNDYIPVTMYGKLGETLGRYLVQDKCVTVVGKLDTGSYKNREGTTVYTWRVLADDIRLNGDIKPVLEEPAPPTPEESVDSPGIDEESGFVELPPGFDDDYYPDEF